jgi:hypothetical protein
MNDIDLQQGQKAIEELESNARKLSEVVQKVVGIEDTLNKLSDLHNVSAKQLAQYDSNFAQLKSDLQQILESGLVSAEEKLNATVKTKIGEGLVELSTRIKDITEEVRDAKRRMSTASEDIQLLNKAFVQSSLDGRSKDRKFLICLVVIVVGNAILLSKQFGLIG